MKIGMLTRRITKGHGQGRVNYEIARAALRRGHQVVLVASQIAPELSSHPSASWIPIPVARWPTDLLRDQVFAWRSFRYLRKYSHQLDVVHANGFITWAASDVNTAHYTHSARLRLPVRIAGLPRYFYDAYQWLYAALNAHWERRAYRQAQVVVAVSEKVRNELVEIGVPDKHLYVIPNGVDLQEFSPGPADRRELGLREGVPLALFAGDIKTSRKNLDTVLHALVEVPALHLAVAGSTEGSPYPRLARRLSLASRVHFLGYRRDVSQLMRAADLFVFPSRYEGHPLVVLEAMASGLPVITAATAGVSNMVDAGCGIVIDDPEDTKALAATLKRLVQYPESRKRMGQVARAVIERYSWQQMSERYLQLYEEVVNQKGLDQGVSRV
jgi:glycosyltransferase involved in cell wall biosynthesis